MVIKELLEHPISVLSSSELPEKQQVNASISLSYRYLTEELKVVACYLALFPGSFTRDAAISVQRKTGAHNERDTWPLVDKDALKKLLYMSLLEYNERTGRYKYHPLMREFFLEQVRQREENKQCVYQPEMFDVGFRAQQLTSKQSM